MSSEWQFLVALDEQLRPLRNPFEIQRVAVRNLGELLGAIQVNFARIDGDEYVVSESYADGIPRLGGRGPLSQLGHTLIEAFRRGETVVVNDFESDTRFRDALQNRTRKPAAFVGVPLIKDGQWLATFSVHSGSPRAWTEDQIVLIEFTAERTWGAGERARAEAALGQSENRQAFLRRLNETIRPLADPDLILTETCRMLGRHLRANRVAYGQIEGDDCVIVGQFADGLPPQPSRFSWVALGKSRTEEILKGGTLTVNDTCTDVHSAEERAALQAAGIGAYICPLLIKDGQFVGSFGIHSRVPRVWTRDEIALVEDVADRIWTTLEHRKAETELQANQEQLAFLLRLNDALRQLADPIAVQAVAARLLSEHLGTSRAGYAESEGADYVILHEHARGVPPLRGSTGRMPVVASLHEALQRGEMLVVHDVQTDARISASERAAFDARQMQAFVGVPLIKEGRSVATFGASHDRPRVWTNREIELVREVAERTWAAVERALAETALREQQQRLLERREEEHHQAFRTLIETATQGIVSVDGRRRIVSANQAFEAMFGWTAGNSVGRPIGRVIPFVFSEGPSVAGTRDLVGIRQDGSSFPIEVTVNHVPGPDGGRAFAFVTDITERQRAGQALQQRTAELEYRTQQLTRMAWDLTLAEHHAREQIARTLHDGLQQLLVVVALDLEQQLKKEADTGVAQSDLLVEAKQQIDEAIAAARSLNLELFPPMLQRSGLPAALTWLAESTREKYKIDVHLTVDPRADSSRKDLRTLLFEAVRELLFNTVKHAQAERVTLDLALDEADELCITVTDCGIGFDVTALDERSKAGQVGWGLFSIRERLALLGGRFDVESAPGQGTRARLTVPRGAEPSADPDHKEVSTFLAEPIADGEYRRATADALRILIVDDHDAVRVALRGMLQQRPQLVVVGDASNGFEAIAHANTLRPDVILMDVGMPHMDGVEATARIRAELPDIRILGMSMHTRGEIADAIGHAGAAGFFVKGTDTQQLIDHLLEYQASRTTAAKT